jgi:hypothetical protein
MAITLGALRTFCQEIASPDSSGSTAEREFMHWINAAIQRVFSACAWDRILHQQKITVLPVETKTTLGVTQGSLAVTLSGADSFRPGASTKYLDDRWELHIDGETDESFELGSITSDTAATLRTGDEWTGSTASNKTCHFAKTIYALPNNAKQVTRVQILETAADVVVLPPHEFDHQRSQNPTSRWAYPRFATLRKGKIEIWPHPGDDYCKLGITYRKGPTVLADADADATEVDWDEEWRDLLLRAITLEASITQGENAPVPYAIALAEFERRLANYKALDANKDVQTGPLGVNVPVSPPRIGEISQSWPLNLEDL